MSTKNWLKYSAGKLELGQIGSEMLIDRPLELHFHPFSQAEQVFVGQDEGDSAVKHLLRRQVVDQNRPRFEPDNCKFKKCQKSNSKDKT